MMPGVLVPVGDGGRDGCGSGDGGGLPVGAAQV